jgi:acyl-CoA-binding protein
LEFLFKIKEEIMIIEENKYINENFLRSIEIFNEIKNKLTPDEELELYGYYQQANFGNNTTNFPKSFNVEARAKWYSWKTK